MIKHQSQYFLCAVVGTLLLWVLPVHAAKAATLSFLPVGDVTSVQTGDLLTFDVVADFTDTPIFGGVFDVTWDPTALAFVSIADNLVGDPDVAQSPDVLGDRLVDWSFGGVSGVSGVNVLGTVSFSVLATMDQSTLLAFECGDSQALCRFPALINLIEIDVALSPIEIARVPLPAAGYLLGSGLMLLLGMRRAGTVT